MLFQITPFKDLQHFWITLYATSQRIESGSTEMANRAAPWEPAMPENSPPECLRSGGGTNLGVDWFRTNTYLVVDWFNVTATSRACVACSLFTTVDYSLASPLGTHMARRLALAHRLNDPADSARHTPQDRTLRPPYTTDHATFTAPRTALTRRPELQEFSDFSLCTPNLR